MILKEVLKIKLSSRRRYALFILLASLVVTAFTIFDSITNTNDDAMVLFNWIIIGVAGLLGLFGLYIVIGASLDMHALKNGKLPVIRAQFIKFNRRGLSPKDKSEIIYTGQVFLDLDNQTEKLLIVSNVELNRKYRIMYGKHTNIGVAIEKI